jgi:hypothetical protein
MRRRGPTGAGGPRGYFEPVNTPAAALQALREELERTLGRPTQGGVANTLRPEEASLTLEFVFEGGGFRIATPADAQAPRHSLTVRFQIGAETGAERGAQAKSIPAADAPTEPPPAPPVDENERAAVIANGCAEVFGPPGFDTSARAEVFVELTVAGTEALLEALQNLAAGIPTPPGHPTARLCARLRQLLNFSPAGPKAAAAILGELIVAHGLERVAGVLAAAWRFGAHWGAAPQDADA